MTSNKTVKTKTARTMSALMASAIVLCGLAYSGLASKQADLAGFVSSVKGTATVVRGSRKPAPMDGMNALRIGDIVRVQPKSSVTVNLCGPAVKMEVKGEAVFTVGKTALAFTKGKGVAGGKVEKTFCNTLMASAAKFDKAAAIKSDVAESMGAMSALNIVSKSGGSGGGSGALADLMKEEKMERSERAMMEKSMAGVEIRGEFERGSGGGGGAMKSIEPPAPDDEGISGSEPESQYLPEIYSRAVMSRALISWEPVSGAVKYEVKIKNVVGAEIFSASVDKTQLVYPESAATPLMPGGWYLCDVVAYDADGMTLSSESFGLDVKSAAEQSGFLAEEKAYLDAAGKGEPGAYILLGKLYEANDMAPLAVEAYEKALSAGQSSALLQLHVIELKENLKLQ